MVSEQRSRPNRRLFSSLRTNGPVAWARASLHCLRILSGGVALRVPHFFPLEQNAPLSARWSPVAGRGCFRYVPVCLLRPADFFRTHWRGPAAAFCEQNRVCRLQNDFWLDFG